MKIMTTFGGRLLLAAAVLLGSGCGPFVRNEGTVVVTGKSVGALVQAADAVIVASVDREGATRNLARDPNDLSKESVDTIVVGQDYALLVEQVLKGVVPNQVTVTVSRGRGTKILGTKDDEDFVRLLKGERYLLFVQRLPYEPQTLVLTAEPNKFLLRSTATVQSAWRDAPTFFPEQPVTTLIGEVRTAVLSQRP